MSVSILGVKIDTLAKKEAAERALSFLRSSGQYRIWTPNPEMLVKAQKDEYFKTVLNKGDLNLCDGFGLWLASGATAERITGVDFMLDLCELAAEKGSRVYLLGSLNTEAAKMAADVLIKNNPNLKIVGTSKGFAVEELTDGQLRYAVEKNDQLLNNIKQVQPDILFVAFGMGKQEKWIDENLLKMPSVKIAMGVGGAFDYISGAVPRAPRLMRQLGLEWLYRLIKQPARAGRIWNATFKFLWLVTTK